MFMAWWHRRHCDVGTLVVEVANASGLMPGHNGSSSACVEVEYDGHWFCTAVKEKDLNPVWNERFYFDYASKKKNLALEACVFSENIKYTSKTFLGRVKIYGDSIPPFSNDKKNHYYKLRKHIYQLHVSGELCLKVYITNDPSVGPSRHPPPAINSGGATGRHAQEAAGAKLLQPLVYPRWKEDSMKKSRGQRLISEAALEGEDISPRPRDIPFVHLKEITDNFSDERILGHGGFGVVYKGVLQNGEMIAVKKIMSSLMPGLQKQFESEVYHLMMLSHPNIVRFVGYCYETRNTCLEYNGKHVFAELAQRLLCFEYLPKGSLDKYLSDESSGLDWSTRYNIVEGICYGLCHLHEKLDKTIIHLDLKPANILLDDGMVPKLIDFGLSRLLDRQQTICTSSRDGTFGYMAPEFIHGGIITPKSDIFSLGVIIIEVVTGYRDYPDVTRTSPNGYIKLTLEKWRNVLRRSTRYGSLESECKQIKRCIQVGLICVNPDRSKRPEISKIINMLQGSESIDCDISNNAC